MMHAIELTGVRKRLSQSTCGPAVDFAIDSLIVNPGELVAVVGPSGSGKSTLLRLIAGLLKPDAGSVAIGSTELTKLSAAGLDRFRGGGVGFVFQDFNLLGPLTVEENLLLALRLGRRVEKSQWQKRVQVSLAVVGLEPLAKQLSGQLSSGERQRLAVVRACINDASILLADEPTGSLDADNSSTVFGLLRKVVEDRQRCCVLVTHDQRIAAACDRQIRTDSWIARTKAAA